MKIAILTIVDYNNYGNRLQNFALQEVLKNMGFEVLTVKNFYKRDSTLSNKIKKIFDPVQFVPVLKNKLKNRFFFGKIDDKRRSNFLKFTKNYITESKNKYFNVDDDYGEFEDVDYFVVGSDQVWNYNYNRFSEMDFGTFTNKPKISYAASFGVDYIPNPLKSFYAKNLSGLEKISVREDAGKKIVESLTDKDASVVLDPTLLLSDKDWLKLTISCPKYRHKYVLTYFLGKPDEETISEIENYAMINSLKVRNLANRTDKRLWVVDPCEFVNLFSQAEKIYTDSFHACVFSVIFKKDFEVFERNGTSGSMNSRIDTLLQMFSLESRWNKNGNVPTREIDYNSVERKLQNKRKESLDFLQNAFKKEEH